MYTLQVTVRDLGDLEVDLALPMEEPGTVGQLVDQAVQYLRWPRLDSNEHPVRYVALDPRTKRPLDGAATLADAGIFRGSIVILAPTGLRSF
ncbi:MAG: EsaB/YukD family protein [Chloroflexi bacterium]|nr:EsaB/YukD family protein [Chloroflexota bacterium]